MTLIFQGRLRSRRGNHNACHGYLGTQLVVENESLGLTPHTVLRRVPLRPLPLPNHEFSRLSQGQGQTYIICSMR